MPATVQLPSVVPPGDAGSPRQRAFDLERLRALALGVEPSDLRARAIVALAESDLPGRIRDLEAILTHESTPSRFRHLAATLLGRIDRATAREVLLGALAVTDERLAGRIAQSLGRIGDGAAFQAIEKASKKFTGVALAQSRFALRLIAHRLDLDLPDWPEDEIALLPRPGEDGHRFTITPASFIDAQIAARSLAREPFGIEVADTAHQIRCDGTRPLLLLERSVGLSPGVALLSRKHLAGVVCQPAEAAGSYSAALLILTAPGARGEQVAVSCYQPTGTLVMAGSIAPKEKRLVFELRSVARRGGVAIYMKGDLAGNDIVFSTARAGCSSRAVGRPNPLTTP